MPPIEVIASPVRDRISIPIPKEYRAYSFVVTLTPVKGPESNGRGRRSSRRTEKSKVEKPIYTTVHSGSKWLVDPSITSTAELLAIGEGEMFK